MSGYIRILVDGYNLLHAWPELADSYPRYSEEARDELAFYLQNYQDQTGVPVSLIFDGNQAPKEPVEKKPKKEKKKQSNDRFELEILYSPPGMSADNVIERVAYRLQQFGPCLVVTNDGLQRNLVHSFGAVTQSCQSFILQLQTARSDLHKKIHYYNHKENNHFRR